MAEFEELVLKVSLDDQASEKLVALKCNVSELGGSTQAAGFERFKRQTQDLDETIKKFISQIGEGPRAFAEFARGAGVGHDARRDVSAACTHKRGHWPNVNRTCRYGGNGVTRSGHRDAFAERNIMESLAESKISPP